MRSKVAVLKVKPESILEDISRLMELGNFYSYFYHHVIHWPLVQGRLYRRWLKDTPWGRLFGSYPER